MDEEALDDLIDLETRGRLELEGALDAHAAEALRLQIRRLARQYGIDGLDVTIETGPDDPPSAPV